ncbi:hypothetical protein M9H77_12405 [Catharanthus roseus]|uniref:Uncharacterized protein n=1 Tax=Catharanthus roseus TaxID=4058 RepID=A0ACC0BHE9_CATRO|nr:hypothetical protein M9H77_12405 [Catharanthus roseus]
MRGTFRGCTTDRGSPCATSGLGLIPYSCIASSVRSAYGTGPSCSTWCYVEVDDMTTGVLEGPPSSSTQYTSVMRKVQTIINCHRVVVPGSMYLSMCLGVKRGACRLPGGGARRRCPLTTPHPGKRGRADP